MIKYILTDIEGTTTSITFVHDELFPYSRSRIKSFIETHQEQPSVKKILNSIPGSIDIKIKLLLEWIDADKKEKPLKDLQGLIWEEGYLTSQIKGHVYPEVADQLKNWKQNGITLGVYSSGSIHAQKLLFKYSLAGDLDQFFTHNFDTSIGHKRDPESYQRIIQVLNLSPNEILFLSDIKEELDAAKATGMQTVQLIRESISLASHNESHARVSDFNQIKV